MDDRADRDDQRLLGEYAEREAQKVAQFKREAQQYLRVERRSVDKSIRWDSACGGLPNANEIYANRGWPSTEEEGILKKDFLMLFGQRFELD